MKKALLTMAIAGLGFGTAKAQLPIGSVAPDFTLTDINGMSHNLYNYLDQGYTVLIDISAAWCGPCWSASQNGFMKNLYEQYGPTGTVTPGKIMVLFVEGEAQNTTAQLHGVNGAGVLATQGDWVTGKPYPIIDDASINSLYQLGGFPTFTLVCPNRQVAYSVAGFGSSMGSTQFWMNYVGNCPIAVTGTNVGTIGVNTPASVCAGGTTTLSTKIQNLGSVPLTSATITAKVNGASIASFNWSGNLPKYGMADVNIGTYTFTQPSTVVTYEATTNNDVNASDNSKTANADAITSTYKSWVLEVKTDNYPGEVAWTVKNSSNATVQSHSYQAGPGQAGAGGPDAMKLFTHVLHLSENECYTIEITDVYGDGLYGVNSAADTGYVRLKDGAGVVYNFGANYGEGISKIAKTGTNVLSVNKLNNVGEITLYPNPINDILNIKMSLVNGSKVAFNITNVLGQQVGNVQTMNFNAGENTTSINTSNLTNGIYFLNIVTDEGSVQHKFIKK